MTKIAGSGSISQRHGSADPDPDPPQNVMDPQHWINHTGFLSLCTPPPFPNALPKGTYEICQDLDYCESKVINVDRIHKEINYLYVLSVLFFNDFSEKIYSKITSLETQMQDYVRYLYLGVRAASTFINWYILLCFIAI
jgi:hypothetical protein